MATQVEALLPGNPLLATEHGEVMPEEDARSGEDSRGDDGAKTRQTGVAEPGSGGSSPGRQGGTTAEDAEERTSNEATEEEDKQNEDGVKGRKEFTEAPPPKVNPWTRKMNAVVTVVSVNGQAHHESTGPAKVVRAGNPPKPRRGGKVGDFGDANSWPTPGEIATKDMQVGCCLFVCLFEKR
ncbi:la-related protein 1 [Cebidichthys violaceus]|uniref:la-related protein 1 n=1 Tax=Cebidichthys violaceus TaxID=271503 RepID=UPI0035CC3163